MVLKGKEIAGKSSTGKRKSASKSSDAAEKSSSRRKRRPNVMKFINDEATGVDSDGEDEVDNKDEDDQVIMQIMEAKTTTLMFASGKMGIPASVQIFSCDKDAKAQPVAWRSFFWCYTVQLHWNYGATGLLRVAQSDVDKINQSYYGESKLNYLTTDGNHEGPVPLRMTFKLIG